MVKLVSKADSTLNPAAAAALTNLQQLHKKARLKERSPRETEVRAERKKMEKGEGEKESEYGVRVSRLLGRRERVCFQSNGLLNK